MKRNTTLPSYVYKLEEARRLRDNAGLANSFGTVSNRLDVYKVASELGVAHPVVLGTFDDITAVQWHKLTGRFVVKPISSSSLRGLFPLEARGNAFWDLLRGVTWTPLEIIGRSIDERIRHNLAAATLVEEFVFDPDMPTTVPDRMRLHCFDGAARLIVRRDLRSSPHSSDWRFRVWLRDWTSVEVDESSRIDGELRLPLDATRILEVGDHISSSTRLPYVAVDVFEVGPRILLNDIVQLPGIPPVHSDNLDRWMGQWWEEAESAVTARQERDSQKNS